MVYQFYGLVYVSFSNNTSRLNMIETLNVYHSKVFFLGLLYQCFVAFMKLSCIFQTTNIGIPKLKPFIL